MSKRKTPYTGHNPRRLADVAAAFAKRMCACTSIEGHGFNHDDSGSEYAETYMQNDIDRMREVMDELETRWHEEIARRAAEKGYS